MENQAKLPQQVGIYLVWTCYNLGKLAFLLILAFNNGFDDARVVAAQVDEDIADAIFPQGFEKGERCCVSMFWLIV